MLIFYKVYTVEFIRDTFETDLIQKITTLRKPAFSVILSSVILIIQKTHDLVLVCVVADSFAQFKV